MNVCPSCGTSYDQNAAFCPACGTPAPVTPRPVVPAQAAAPSASSPSLAPLTRVRNMLAIVSAGSLALWVILNIVSDIAYNGTRGVEYGTTAYYAASDLSAGINLVAGALSYVVSAAFVALFVSIVLIAYRRTIR